MSLLRKIVSGLLLASFNIDQATFLAQLNEPIKNTQAEDFFNQAIQQRLEQRPLEYITQSCQFMEHAYSIRTGVLVPRPETELLVVKAMEYLKKNKSVTTTILELGSGAGIISIELGLRFPEKNIQLGYQ